MVVTPGNPGMPGVPGDAYPVTVTEAPPQALDAPLVVIGPEAPLVAGLADELRAEGRKVVGPGADGAALEGSKAFMKGLLAEAGVPTARFGVFEDEAAAAAYLATLEPPYVVKTDGLAAGKGVLVTDDLGQARADVAAKLSGSSFGEAGRRVVIEEGLEGPEVSLIVLCDGRRLAPLALAQDFKRVADGDAGPNTGGMGAYAPLPWAPAGLTDRLLEEAVEPLVHAFRRRGIDYRGVLYAGCILTAEGPKVLEYNVRFGDPEAQVLLPLTDADLVAVFEAVAEGRLVASVADRLRFEGAAVCVVAASAGYPEAPRTGEEIVGLADDGQLADPVPAASVLHAATTKEAGRFRTAGGRVLDFVGVGPDVPQARQAAYRAVERVSFAGCQVRQDIAAGLEPAAAP